MSEYSIAIKTAVGLFKELSIADLEGLLAANELGKHPKIVKLNFLIDRLRDLNNTPQPSPENRDFSEAINAEGILKAEQNPLKKLDLLKRIFENQEKLEQLRQMPDNRGKVDDAKKFFNSAFKLFITQSVDSAYATLRTALTTFNNYYENILIKEKINIPSGSSEPHSIFLATEKRDAGLRILDKVPDKPNITDSDNPLSKIFQQYKTEKPIIDQNRRLEEFTKASSADWELTKVFKSVFGTFAKVGLFFYHKAKDTTGGTLEKKLENIHKVDLPNPNPK